MSWLFRHLGSWRSPRPTVFGLGIVGLAFFLRAWRIGELPPGLLSDEGYNLIDILDMRDTGTYPLFFERNLGREPLFIYVQALSVAVFGPTPFAARIVSVFLGTLTVALLHRFARNVFGADSWVPTVSSLVLAATLYHTILSRVGLRSISLSPLTIAALLALWAAYQAGKTRFFLAAGAGFALTFYSYIAARSLPLVPVGLLALSWLRSWPQPERLLLKAALASVTFLVLLAPLGFVAWHSPDIFWERSGTEMFIGSHTGIAGVVDNARQVAAMFLLQGDPWIGNTLPGHPIYDPAMGFLFVAGLAVALVSIVPPLRSRLPALRSSEAAVWLVILWLIAALLPVWLSVGLSFLRALNVAAPAAIFCGLGADALRRLANRRLQRTLALGIVCLCLSIGVANAGYSLFVLWPRALGEGAAFSTDIFALVNYVQSRTSERRVYLDASAFDGHGTVLLALRSVTVQFADTGLMLVTGASVEHVVLEDAAGTNKAMSSWLPNETPVPIGPAPSFTVGGARYLSYSFDNAVQALPGRTWQTTPSAQATIGGELRITGASISADSSQGPLQPSVEIILRWEIVSAPTNDYSLSLRAVNDARQTLAQADGRLGGAYISTSAWRSGDIVYTLHHLRLPQEALAEPLHLVAVTYYRGPPLQNLQVQVDGELRGELLDLGAYQLEQ